MNKGEKFNLLTIVEKEKAKREEELVVANEEKAKRASEFRMPRMNGLEATQKIRHFNKDVIIIAQTAYAFSGDSEKALEAGCNDYISKPISKTLLYELIKKYFNKK